MPDTGVRLSLLNAFALVCDGETVHLPLSAQRLLAFVALHDYPLHRAYVSGVLWADSSQDRAAGSLRSSLWRLHRPGYQLIDATSTHLYLAADVDVDIRPGLAQACGLLNGFVGRQLTLFARAEYGRGVRSCGGRWSRGR
jgi:hypothetical protein